MSGTSSVEAAVRSRAAGPEEGPVREDRITQAYEKLRELIVWGRLAPGTRIVESDIAGRLEISRTPVRSALQRLQQEGYIVAAADGGKHTRLAVAPLTIQDARELFSIVAEVEGLAARRAAELDERARTMLARTLRRLNGELLSAAGAARPDTNRIFDLDVAFHRSYAEAAAGPRLQALYNAVKPQVERYNRLYTTALVGEIQTSVAEHEEIVRCIAGGDPDGAAAAAGTNFRNAAERLREVIISLGERGSW
jgi:DNA-binding GntR family transcriptional regulator